ncbi:MAG: transporter substrate-binding domain-containing protein [Desulfobacterales bacterium]|nr:transporter substrate-binding domain-containing protein [Desulfobacterales bacterium]
MVCLKRFRRTALFLFTIGVTVILPPWIPAADLSILTLEEPPQNFTDSSGKLTGLSIDIVKEIQNRIGNKTPIKVYPWKRAYLKALKEPNVVLFTAARTPAREDRFHWITLVNRNAWQFFAKKGERIKISHLDQAKNVEAIGVLRGGAREALLKTKGFTNLSPVAAHIQNIKKLVSGRIDLMFYAPTGAAQTCRNANIPFSDLSPVFTVSVIEAYIVMSKNGTPDHRVRQWKTAADNIKADGTYGRIARKWQAYMYRVNHLSTFIEDGGLNLWAPAPHQ